MASLLKPLEGSFSSIPWTTEPRRPEGEGVELVKRGISTLEIAEYAVVASCAAGWPGCGRGNAVTMVLRAVLGTEVSIVWEAVKSVSLFRSGVRLSNGKRRTRGPRLEKR